MPKFFRVTSPVFLVAVLCMGFVGTAPATAQNRPAPYIGQEIGPQAVPTFQSVGLYWKPAYGSSDQVCSVKYRIKGEPAWRDALPLWFDPAVHKDLSAHSQQYRGSIVNLQPGTTYEVELSLGKANLKRSLIFTTWSNDFKIARRVELPVHQPSHEFVITEGGSEEDGYVLYVPPAGLNADWNADDRWPENLRIAASYVIVQGLTLRNASANGIVLDDVHHVVIQDCDISGWGRVDAGDGFGVNLDAAIFSNSSELEQIVVQRCWLHHPRSDANSWSQQRQNGSYHPMGAQAIVFRGGKGRYVIRDNRIESDFEHMFNDGMGEVKNFGFAGFPNRDSDISGNYVSHCWDDGIEVEGANMNVRVWNNYITQTFGAFGGASTSLGPVYYFRNVYAVSRADEGDDDRAHRGGYLFKLGSEPRDAEFSMGRKYFFHNTTLQPRALSGPAALSGAQAGIVLASNTKRELNIVSRNNIYYLRSSSDQAIRDPQRSTSNSFDYDMFVGRVQAAGGAEAHGVRTIPDFEAAPDGRLWLKGGTPGIDAAEPLANFNDAYTGQGPDIGAIERDDPAAKPATWPVFPPQYVPPVTDEKTTEPPATPEAATSTMPAPPTPQNGAR